MSIASTGSSALSPMNSSSGAELLTAALSKNHQKMNGQAVLTLLQAAAQSSPAPSANPAVGTNINISV